MMKRTWLLPLLIALLCWGAGPARVVQAHANLIGSSPAPGDVLPSFPTAVQMEFSEAVAPDSARLALLNADGQVVAQGAITFSPANASVLFAAFPTQPDGIYTIRWQVQSAQDGHITAGTIPFSVGLHTPQVSLLPPPGAPDPATDFPALPDIFFRGVGYLSVLLLVGPALFAVLIWRPAILYVGNSIYGWDLGMTRGFHRLLVLGGLAGLLDWFGLAVWQTIQLAGVPGLHPGWIYALFALVSWVSWLRLAVLLALTVLAYRMPLAGQGRPALWWSSVGLGGVLVLTYSLSGHNAAAGSAVGVVVDGLHVAAMSIWVGGLLPLAMLLLRQRKMKDEGAMALTAIVSNRFSDLALIAVVLLAISGLFSALLQVQTLSALWGTRYGQALILKTILFALLIGFGAVNQRLLLPRMARSDIRAFQWLGRTVRAEIGLAMLLLFVVGALMSLSPAYAALQAERKMGVHDWYRERQVQMDLRVAPAIVGQNEFGVDIQDNRPGAGRVPPTVLLRFRMLMQGMDTEVTQVTAVPAGNQRYTVRGSYMAMEAVWEVEVILRKPGFDDVRHAFRIDFARPTGE